MTSELSCILMRGGTSKGPFFKMSDLPADPERRNRVLLEVMGSPHPLQIDGVGGAQAQTSKVAMVGKSEREGVDVDYLFAQVAVDKAVVDTSPNCGNMITAVAPFALEAGLVKAEEGKTTVRIHNLNTSTEVEAEIITRNGRVLYEGDFEMDGVPGSGSPVYLRFGNAEGAKTGKLLPTGKAREEIEGIEVSLVDYSMPMMLLKAESVGLTGCETAAEIDAAEGILKKIESMRRCAGERMGLGNVADLVIPKVGLLSNARNGGTLTSRYLTPRTCHKAHAVTGAMCLAASCYIEGSITADLIGGVLAQDSPVTVEHPGGKLFLEVLLDGSASKIASIATVRTARKIFSGTVFLKRS